MLIYCPQCKTGYDVADDLIPEGGRQLRCSGCGCVFKFDRSGVSESLPESEAVSEAEPVAEEEISEPTLQVTEPKKELPSEIDLNDIFVRLNEQSEQLLQEEKKLPKKQRLALWFKTMLGLNRRSGLKSLFLGVMIVGLIALYNYRYEIVRMLPFMNSVYKTVGIRARIPGEGLEFQNINWNYIDTDDGRILEVKGFINNPSQREIRIPVVHVELLDANSMLLQSINQKPTTELLKADSRATLSIVIKSPSPTAKYVYLTFIEQD